MFNGCKYECKVEHTEAEIDFIPSIHIFEQGLIRLQANDSQIIFKKNLSWDHKM